MRQRGMAAWMAGLFILFVGVARGEQPLAVFTMEDHLRREWRNELVFFPVDGAIWGRKDISLRTAAGAAVPHQWVKAEDSPRGKPSIAFLAHVPKLAKAEYQIVAGAVAVDSELRITESPEMLEVSNAAIGLRLHRGAK